MLLSFSEVLNTKRRQIIENRAGLKLIINTILPCGRQSFPSREHRDNGGLFFDDESVVENGRF